MKYILFIGNFLFWGFCEITCVTPKDSRWSDSFMFPYNKPALRIIGGQEATPNQFPYQVGMYIEYQLQEAFCGGSLISPNYVLTAAHCAEGAVSIDLIFGAQNISDDSESTRQRQTSTDYVVHPDWDVNTITSDVAIVKLTEPVTLNDYVQVVQLADGSDTYAGSQGTITGWGKTSDNQQGVSDILRYATNNVLSNEECKATGAEYEAIIQDVHLCFSGDGDKGICQGDSGGPVVTDGIQIGIGSFTYQSCEANKPSVFVRLTKFAQWIKDNSDVTF